MPEKVEQALEGFRRHLNPDGIVLIEPWFTPDQWNAGKPHMLTVDLPDLKICRMNTTYCDGTISGFDFHYLIGKSEGIEQINEKHELALYTQHQMTGFFEKTGLTVEYDPEGISGRGLYVGRAKQ